MQKKNLENENKIKTKVNEEISQEIEGFRYVERTYSKSGDLLINKSNQEKIKVKKFFGKVAEVECSSGITINLGDYESAKVFCSVKLPCYVEEIEEAQKCAFKYVENALVQQVEEVRSDSNEIKNKYSKKEFEGSGDDF